MEINSKNVLINNKLIKEVIDYNTIVFKNKLLLIVLIILQHLRLDERFLITFQ